MTRCAALSWIGLVLAGSLVLVAPAAFSDIDYSRLPEPPAETAKRLAAAGTTLRGAIEIAEKHVSGAARSASASVGDGTVTFEVVVVADGKTFDIRVDGMTGAVVSSTEIPVLPGDPVSGNWTETDSGLGYYDIRVGEGDVPPSSSTQVKVHYSGWLVDGTQFDSSVERGEPAVFPLNRVIPGWTEGVGGMKVGGKRKLIIPYELAYGPQGRPPTIPPAAMLIFDVELLEIVK